LKAYLLVLASGGTRAVEALAIRIKDIDFSISPTKIHIRKEYTKTKCARDIYISEEATQYLKQWIDWKYRDKGENTKRRHPDDLVFSIYTIKNEPNPTHLYQKILIEFENFKLQGLTKEKKKAYIRDEKLLYTLLEGL
jgi:integrase